MGFVILLGDIAVKRTKTCVNAGYLYPAILTVLRCGMTVKLRDFLAKRNAGNSTFFAVLRDIDFSALRKQGAGLILRKFDV